MKLLLIGVALYLVYQSQTVAAQPTALAPNGEHAAPSSQLFGNQDAGGGGSDEGADWNFAPATYQPGGSPGGSTQSAGGNRTMPQVFYSIGPDGMILATLAEYPQKIGASHMYVR